MGWFATRVAVGLAGAAGILFAVATPALAQGGYRAQITELPEEAVAGEGPIGLTVVVSRDLGGDCEKVRWSMVLRSDGVGLDQIRAARIEQDGAFALDVQVDGDTARLTDVQLDPGTLCQDRTVTAEYQFSFTDDAEGRVTFTAEAYNVDAELLADTAATLPVVTEAGASADPEPSETPVDLVEEEPVGGATDPAAGAGGGAAQPTGAIPAGDTSGIPVAWFIAGGALVFVGFGLLMRVRARLLRATGDVDGPLAATAGPGRSGTLWQSATAPTASWPQTTAPHPAANWPDTQTQTQTQVRSRPGRGRWR